MKKLLVIFMILGMFVVSANAADVVISITIPDAHVARVQAAVTGELHCDGANAKDCLKKYLVNYIKQLVKGYENTLSQRDFNADYQELQAD